MCLFSQRRTASHGPAPAPCDPAAEYQPQSRFSPSQALPAAPRRGFFLPAAASVYPCPSRPPCRVASLHHPSKNGDRKGRKVRKKGMSALRGRCPPAAEASPRLNGSSDRPLNCLFGGGPSKSSAWSLGRAPSPRPSADGRATQPTLLPTGWAFCGNRLYRLPAAAAFFAPPAAGPELSQRNKRDRCGASVPFKVDLFSG